MEILEKPTQVKVVNPFKGPFSYSEYDENIFFGREDEKFRLLQLVKLNPLTIFYGKSGMGKSSVLQAGLIPALKKNFFAPIYIRPDYADSEEDFNIFIKQAIMSYKKDCNDPLVHVEDIGQEETLWEYFHKAPFKLKDNIIVPVLIFDQFEEIFTKGKLANGLYSDNITKLVDTLSSLIENYIPEDIAASVDFENLYFKYCDHKPICRVLFSLREEFLPQLESVAEKIPSILHGNSHFRLKPLSYIDAIDVVKKGGNGVFEYEAIVKMINLISNINESEVEKFKSRIGIEPFILSLFCYEEFEQIDNKHKIKITAKDIVPNKLNNILSDFYCNKIKHYAPHVRVFIEEKLISEKGNRRLYPWENALTLDGISIDEINSLIGDKLISKQTIFSSHMEDKNFLSATGHYTEKNTYLEVIHDKLTEIIKKDRDARRIRDSNERIKQGRKKRIFQLAITSCAFLFLSVLIYIYVNNLIHKEVNSNITKYNKYLKKNEEDIKAINKQLLDAELTVSAYQSTAASTNDLIQRQKDSLTLLKDSLRIRKNGLEKARQNIRDFKGKSAGLDKRDNEILSELDKVKIQLIFLQDKVNNNNQFIQSFPKQSDKYTLLLQEQNKEFKLIISDLDKLSKTITNNK